MSNVTLLSLDQTEASSLLAKVELLGVAIETLMYGIFLTLFPQTLFVILRYPKSSSFGSISQFNKAVMVICTALFCAITAVSASQQSVLFTYLTDY